MNWQDTITQPLVITTGDGKVYTPLMPQGTETSKDFNFAAFDSIDLEGSLVVRKKVRSRQFPMVFWFQGSDNIDQADAFDLSANDPRAWIVKHPKYGTITGQPTKLGRNDTNYNITEITVEFWETITGKLPVANVSIPDSTAAQCAQLADTSAADYSAKVDLTSNDVQQVTTATQNLNANTVKVLDNSSYNDYIATANAMFAAVNNLVSDPEDAINAIYSAIMAPAQFDLPVTQRITLLQTIFTGIINLLPLNRNNKAFIESAAGASVGALCLALVNPVAGNYQSRTDIASASAALQSTYSQYRHAMDNAYVRISDPVNSFSASNPTQAAIQTLVIATIANLNTLAFSAKQERSTYLDKDSNLIVLTHKYIGLDANDENLEAFRQLNNIRNRELIQVKKGRLIKYLV